jgi:predicted aspartyl protease
MMRTKLVCGAALLAACVTIGPSTPTHAEDRVTAQSTVTAPLQQPNHPIDWWVQRGFRSVNPTDDERQAIYRQQQLMSVPMQRRGGLYVVPVLINDAITLDFVVDSGADDVRIPADVVMTLMRTGSLMESDFLGQKTYVLANGSTVLSKTFRIRSLKVGDKVLENVIGSTSERGFLLLGQSFLSRFKSWSVDNNKHALVLE